MEEKLSIFRVGSYEDMNSLPLPPTPAVPPSHSLAPDY